MTQPSVLLLDENRGFGGAERHAVSLARELDQRDILAAVGARKDSWLYEHCQGLPVNAIGFRNEVDMFSVFSLYKLIKSCQANVLHCIAHRDLVAAALARQLPGAPRLVLLKAEHSFPDNDLSPLFRWAYRQCDAIVCVSEVLRGRFAEALGHGPEWPSELCVVANGIELPELAPPRGVEEGPLRVGVLSALRPEKGQADVLEALGTASADLLKSIDLSFAGEGLLADELRQRSRELGLSVEFLGHQERPNEYLSELDLCILPSHVETFSLVALECLCQGVPLLAAKSPGVEELYREPEMTFAVGDTSELLQKLEQFVRTPEPARQRARQLALEYRGDYSREAMGQRYHDLYQRLLSPSAVAL